MLASACVVAGCGGGSDSATTSSPSSTTGTAAAKLSGPPIKIGMISAETNPKTGLTMPEARAGVDARIQAINADGGINGRPAQLVACDGKDNPNSTADCARKMVDEQVVAVIGAANSTEAQIMPILEQAKIPVVGAIPETPAVGDSPVAFCFDPGVAGDFLGAPRLLGDQGAKKASMLVPGGLPGTGPAEQAFNAGVAAAGIDNGGVVTFTPGQSQFDAEVAKATSDGVDGVFAFAPAQSIGPLMQTIRQQKPDVKAATLTVNFGPEQIESLGSAAEGILAVGLGQPATADVPGIKHFNADMDQYGGDAPRTDFAINAWASTWLLERVAQKLEKVDAASVLAAMGKLQDEDMGGIYPPITTTKPFKGFPGMSCVYNPTVVYQTVKDGKLTAIEPGKFADAFPPAPAAGK